MVGQEHSIAAHTRDVVEMNRYTFSLTLTVATTYIPRVRTIETSAVAAAATLEKEESRQLERRKK